MSEFDIFTIDSKIKENTTRLEKLKRALAKIKSNQESMEVKSIERVNKVAMFNVLITHTNDYTIKLNNDYFAKVKATTADQIIQARIAHFEDQNKKWVHMKSQISKSAEKMKNNQDTQRDFNSKFQSTRQVIGQNEEGEEIFNIVEYSENEKQPIRAKQAEKVLLKPQKQQEQLKQPIVNQTQAKDQSKIEVSIQPSNKSEFKEEVVQVAVEQKPKKISKFKAERMQNKQK